MRIAWTRRTFGLSMILLALIVGTGVGLLTHRTAAATDTGTKPAIMSPGTTDRGEQLFMDMARMHQDMDQLFQRAFDRFHQPANMTTGLEETFQQSMNVQDKKDHYAVEVDLPDRDVSKVDVKLDGNNLKVGYSQTEEKTSKGSEGQSTYSHMVNNFEQTVTLPGPVDATGLKTQREHGRLIITVPKEK